MCETARFVTKNAKITLFLKNLFVLHAHPRVTIIEGKRKKKYRQMHYFRKSSFFSAQPSITVTEAKSNFENRRPKQDDWRQRERIEKHRFTSTAGMSVMSVAICNISTIDKKVLDLQYRFVYNMLLGSKKQDATCGRIRKINIMA